MKIHFFTKISLAIVWPAFVFIVLFFVWMLEQHFSQPDLASAALFPEVSRTIQPFTLVDHNGRSFDKEHLAGKWSFVFFGYTHCPDICPLTLQTLALVADLLEKPDNGNVQFIFVSVDPQRDNSAHLKNYVGYFNPGFIGISGQQQQLSAFGKALGAPFGKADKFGSGSYLMSHSAEIFLISPEAERYAMLPQPHQAGSIVSDFNTIRSYFEQEANNRGLLKL